MSGIYKHHSTPPSGSGSAVSFQEFVQGLQQKTGQRSGGDEQRPRSHRDTSQSSLISTRSDTSGDFPVGLGIDTPGDQISDPFEDHSGQSPDISQGPPSLAESFDAARPKSARYPSRRLSGGGLQGKRSDLTTKLDTNLPSSARPLSVGPEVSTAYRGYAGANEYLPQRSNTQVSRSKSILDRTKEKLNWRQKPDRYNALQDVDEGNEQDIVTVDISSFGGPMELTDFNSTTYPSGPSHTRGISDTHSSLGGASSSTIGEMEPLKTAGLGYGLGKGMKIGRSLRVNSVTNPSRGIAENSKPQATARNELSRAATIRKIGQREAQQLGEIVAVDDLTPAFDLSTYEGMKRGSTDAKSFDAIESTTDPNKQSYFYPEDPQQPNWKPFSMRKPYIIVLIVISLALAGIQEWLCQRSIRLAKTHYGLINFDKVSEVSLLDFVIWKYLPTLIFVVYGVLWQIMDYETKRLEPYYQLSRPTGSPAAESLNVDYLTMWSNLAPIKAIQYRQWAVLCSAMGNLLASSAAASLQNPSIVFGQNDPKLRENPKFRDIPVYYVRVSPGWSRVLTLTLLVVAVLGIVLLLQLRRKSGLLSDPKGIAGIAAMATKSHILTDFQGVDELTHRSVHEKLKHRRYILYKSSIWQGEYIKHTPDRPDDRVLENPHPIMLRLKAGIPFLGFLIFFLIFIPLISLTPANIIPNKAPIIPVLLATIIKQLWTTFEFDVRMMEPFYILSKGHAPPESTLTLDYTGTPYAFITYKSLFNKHYLLSLVSFGSILVDILTVTVSSFSVNGRNLLRRPNAHESQDSLSSGDQTFKSFWVSVALSIAICIFLVFCAALVYLRRRHPFLPRQPSTIASVLAFIHQSKMLYDFVDTETLTNSQMEAKLKETGKTYGLGWFKGRDGQHHCGIDEEELVSRYVHGKSYLKAVGPWVDSSVF